MAGPKKYFSNKKYIYDSSFALDLIVRDWSYILDKCFKRGNLFFSIKIDVTTYNYDSDFEYISTIYREHYYKIRTAIYTQFPTTSLLFIILQKTPTGGLQYIITLGLGRVTNIDNTVNDDISKSILTSGISPYISVTPLQDYLAVKDYIVSMHDSIFKWKYSGCIYCLYKYCTEYFYTSDDDVFGLGDIYGFMCTFSYVRGDQKFIKYNQDIVDIDILDRVDIEKLVGHEIAVNSDINLDEYIKLEVAKNKNS